MRNERPLYNVLGLGLSACQLVTEGSPILTVDECMAKTVGADLMPSSGYSPQQRFDAWNVIAEDEECRSYSMPCQKAEQLLGSGLDATLKQTPFAYRDLYPLIPLLEINCEGV